MTYNDIIGTIGVGIILFAYFLNTMKYIPVNGKLYFVLNSIGGALSCYAALLINFWPFVILEAVWTFVSVYGLMRTMRIRKIGVRRQIQSAYSRYTLPFYLLYSIFCILTSHLSTTIGHRFHIDPSPFKLVARVDTCDLI